MAQVYGTQFVGRETGWIPRQLRDPDGVDERRAQRGLGTLADNATRMAVEYGAPTPVTIICPDCGEKIKAWPPEEGETRPIRCRTCGFSSTFALSVAAEPPDAGGSA